MLRLAGGFWYSPYIGPTNSFASDIHATTSAGIFAGGTMPLVYFNGSHWKALTNPTSAKGVVVRSVWALGYNRAYAATEHGGSGSAATARATPSTVTRPRAASRPSGACPRT